MNWKGHTVWAVVVLIGAVIAYFSVKSWIGEHDARIRAEDQERVSEQVIRGNNTTIDRLTEAVADREQERDKAVSALRRTQAAIKTPAQAVAAIPDLTGIPATSFRPLPSGNYEVEAPALVTIAHQLAEVPILREQLNSCNDVLGSQKQINALLASNNAELTKEKESWKKAAGHRSWLGKTWDTAKPILAGIAGVVIGSKL